MALLQKAYLGATPLFKERSWFEQMPNKPINESAQTTVTANSSAHTKGSWVELISATSANASYVVIQVGSVGTSGVNTAALVDIGTGASGSEAALIGDIAVGGASNVSSDRSQLAFGVPIKIPSGTRLSARIQSLVTGGRNMNVTVWVFDMGDYSIAPASVDVLGTNTATSEGTVMSGASGTWVEIVASTASAYRAVVLVPSINSDTTANLITEFQVGTGASGSETELGRTFANFTIAEQSATNTRLPSLIAGAIAAGTRLAVRHDIPSSPTGYAVTLIGIP
jgi:hypothetical protein